MHSKKSLENLYGRLIGIRQMRGIMTDQSRKDLNEIVRTLARMDILSQNEVFSFYVNEFTAPEEALFSGVPEKAVQLLSILEQRFELRRSTRNEEDAISKWVLADQITLAVVFTDIIKSTKLVEKLGDSKWNEIRKDHFSKGKDLSESNEGFLVKTMGDGMLLIFRNAVAALKFTMEFRRDSGHPQIKIRQGAHIGFVNIENNDVGGRNVNLAARVAEQAKGCEINVTNDFRNAIQKSESSALGLSCWKKLSSITLQGFQNKFILWQVMETHS